MLVCLSVCPFVCKNVKTTEPVGPTIILGPHMTPGKVYKLDDFKILRSMNTN